MADKTAGVAICARLRFPEWDSLSQDRKGSLSQPLGALLSEGGKRPGSRLCWGPSLVPLGYVSWVAASQARASRTDAFCPIGERPALSLAPWGVALLNGQDFKRDPLSRNSLPIPVELGVLQIRIP